MDIVFYASDLFSKINFNFLQGPGFSSLFAASFHLSKSKEFSFSLILHLFIFENAVGIRFWVIEVA